MNFCTFARATELKKWVFRNYRHYAYNDMLIYGDTENCNKTLPSLRRLRIAELAQQVLK